MTRSQGTGRGANRARKRRKPSLKVSLQARLFERIVVTVNGDTRRCTVLEAVILQLLQKTAVGDARARHLLLRYHEFVARAAKPRREVVFIDTDAAPSSLQEGSSGAGV